jgi:hypothetical protein
MFTPFTIDAVAKCLGRKAWNSTHDNATRAAQAVSGEPKEFNGMAWLEKHPDVYVTFRTYALQAIHSGRKVGAKAIGERMRWDAMLENKQGYKVNNDVISLMARRLMWEYPEFNGYFETRGSKYDAII